MKRVLVIGAGLSGLSCARVLHERGLAVEVVDAADAVGGRVRTDEKDGFLFDRGFQVFLPSYPVAGARFKELDFRAFAPGAYVRLGGKFHLVSDPFRDLLGGLATAFAPIGSMKDKLLIALLRQYSMRPRKECTRETSREFLQRFGFSPRMIERFFRPFLGGVFLENALETNAEKLLFVFNHFARGAAALPTGGIAQLPRRLADGLPSPRLNTRVRSLDAGGARLETGESMEADAIVIATHQAQAHRLLGSTGKTTSHGVTCLYFSSPESPLSKKCLVLNGEGNQDGPINNLAVLSDIAPGYSPPDRALISVSILGAHDPSAMTTPVLNQLESWFGDRARDWQYLRGYRIDDALPAQHAGERSPAINVPPNVTLAGDWLENASIEGAIVSGESAAENVLESLANSPPA
ncbi:MAG: NAD(P)/FAD-dependent oxidoreductase [Verrucomicrobiota bacterium]